MKTGTVVAAMLAAIFLAPAASRAEPYLAVRTGFNCGVCHVNPTGGGKRTEFGSAYSQTTLAAERLDPATGKPVPAAAPSDAAVWTGKLNDHFAIGSDLRANLSDSDKERLLSILNTEQAAHIEKYKMLLLESTTADASGRELAGRRLEPPEAVEEVRRLIPPRRRFGRSKTINF